MPQHFDFLNHRERKKGRKTLPTEWISAKVPLSLVLMLVEFCPTFSFLSLPTPFLSSGLVWTGCGRKRESNTPRMPGTASTNFLITAGQELLEIGLILQKSLFHSKLSTNRACDLSVQVTWGRQILFIDCSALFSLYDKNCTIHVPFLNVQFSSVASK